MFQAVLKWLKTLGELIMQPLPVLPVDFGILIMTWYVLTWLIVFYMTLGIFYLAYKGWQWFVLKSRPKTVQVRERTEEFVGPRYHSRRPI